MPETENKNPRLVVSMDFSDELMAQIREAAPNFRVERHFPDIPDSVWGDTEILYTLRKFPQPAQAPRLRWIQLHFAGIEAAIKQPIVQAEDVEVTTASGIHASQMAEWCLSMMLAFNYKVPLMLKYQAKSEWAEKRHSIFAPLPLRGQTVGIAGYGSIGRELARLAHSFGMTVLASKRDPKHPAEEYSYTEPGTGDAAGDIPERIYPSTAIASMAKDCDYLVLAMPLTDESRKIVNQDVLNAMKKTAILINVARGAVVDEAALISALSAQKIGGAALDVFEEEPLPATSPLWHLDNVIISPHVSGNTAIYNQKAAALFIANLGRYSEKRPLFNRLDRKRGY